MNDWCVDYYCFKGWCLRAYMEGISITLVFSLTFPLVIIVIYFSILEKKCLSVCLVTDDRGHTVPDVPFPRIKYDCVSLPHWLAHALWNCCNEIMPNYPVSCSICFNIGIFVLIILTVSLASLARTSFNTCSGTMASYPVSWDICFNIEKSALFQVNWRVFKKYSFACWQRIENI